MKVLQVIDSLRLGGAEVLLVQLHERFREHGIECEYYLLHSDNGPLEQKLLRHGARIYSPCHASVYSPLHIRSLSRHFRSHAYDIIHVHLFPAQLWTAIAARLAGAVAPLVTTEHSTRNRRRTRYWRPVDRLMYAQYERIACISPATLESLLQWCPQVTSRAIECPNGIDIDEFSLAAPLDKRNTFSVSQADPVILSVGRLESEKDHQTSIRALISVPNAHLAIAGTGTLLSELRALAERLGVAERVHFLGVRNDVGNLLKTADLFVQASSWEGFGISALEAMASGLPVIASDVPGLAEVVAGGGLLFPPGNHQRLSECITSLFQNPRRRCELACSGQRRAKEFSIAKTRDRYEELYRSAMATRKESRKNAAPLNCHNC